MHDIESAGSDAAIEASGETKESSEGPLSQLGRIISKTSTQNFGPPPDGGWFACMQVVLVHLTVIDTWGFINSFGVLYSPTSLLNIS